MSRALVVINSETDRQKASTWVRKAPWGCRIEFKQAKRSTEQNSKMWVMLTEVAQQLPYHGLRLTADDWKLIFLDALKREVRMVPNLDGNGFVSLGRSSSDLSKTEMTDLIELIHEFGARHGVTFHDPADTADNANSAPQVAAVAIEAPDPSFVARETGTASTAIPDETTEPSADSQADAGRDEDAPIDVAADQSVEPAEAADHRPGTPAPEAQDGPVAATSPAELITRNLMLECMEKFLQVATDPKVPDAIDRRGNVVFAKNIWKDELKGNQDFVKACFQTADQVVKGLKTADDARTHLESLVA